MKKLISALLAGLFLTSALVGCSAEGVKNDPQSTAEETKNDPQNTQGDYSIAQAVYPVMAKYPNEQDPDFQEQYRAWNESQLAKRQNQTAYDQSGLNPYFTSSMKEFLAGAGSKNRAYSPVNVFMALSMLAELTDGNSRAQILNLLGAESIDTLRLQASSVWNANYNDDGAVTSILANSLWLNQNVAFKQDTLNTLAETYYASSFSGEMGSDAYNHAVQAWLDEQTGGLLKDQASQIEFNARTVMALATTIYYQARWSDEFSKGRTADGIFHATDGDETCRFMNETIIDRYFYSDKFSAVAKRLEGSGSMYFILPEEGISIDELLADSKTYDLFLTEDGIDQKYVQINLSVPQFDVVSDIDLIDGLKALGITDVFDFGKSDFTPMTEDTEEIAIEEAKHAARVKIDEEGVVAAAYTVMIGATGSAMPEETVDFMLDRPFLFVITGEDGLPLFTGVVNHP